MQILGLERGWKVDWLKGNGKKSTLGWILGHLTPRATLGLESCPYYSGWAPERCQQSHSGWMWMCGTSCSPRSISSPAALGCWSHQPQGGESAKVRCEPGNSGCNPFSGSLAHPLGQRRHGGKHKAARDAGLCQHPNPTVVPFQKECFIWAFPLQQDSPPTDSPPTASDPPAFPQAVHRTKVNSCGLK